ncbi:MAG: methyl-accepting chemotaxis protein [Pirellulales bacterium]
MKNLSVKTKVGVIVAVLAATVLAVAVVGARQLDRVNARMQTLVDDVGKADNLNSALRIELLGVIRMEKNAALVADEKRAAEFGLQAKQHADRVDELLAQLETTLDTSGDAEQQKALDDFRTSWQSYHQSHAEVLRLATLNTNTRARRLLHDEVQPVADDLKSFFERTAARLAERPAGEGTSNASSVATLLRAAALPAELTNLLHRHVNSLDETEMNELDARVREVLDAAAASLADLKLASDPAAQAEALRLAADVRKLKSQVAEIQRLSRENSNLAAIQLSVTTNFERSTAANAALSRLSQRLDDRMTQERDASHLDYLWGLGALAVAGVGGVIVGSALALLIARSIVFPLIKGVELAKAIAAGDLTQRLALEQRDEVGQLTDAMDHAAEAFARIVFEIHKLSDELGASATDLSQVSHGLLAQSEEMSIQASNVAGGAEQMTGNINTMAAAAEEMSMNVSSISSASEQISVNVGTISAAAQSTAGNVQTVAGAVQEATASFQHVAGEARQSAEVTAEASNLAHQATDKMQALDRAAHEISKVTEMIKLIAMQTNLLALNATIEATSAGEAGKGFAVVADEIKELAGQSGKAAQDIAHMIEGIQSSTREAVGVIDQVAETITAINTASERISAAVERQSQVAQQSAGNLEAASKGVGHIAQSIAEVAKGASDMSRNAGDASHAAGDVAHNASEAARAVRDIASNIHGVSGSAKDATSGAQQVNAAATGMQQVSARLDRLVQQFRVKCETMGR